MKTLAVAVVLGVLTILCSVQAFAASPHVVIAAVQAGAPSASGAAQQEFVVLYNNSTTRVDVSGWCLTNKTSVTFVCMTPTASNEKLYVQPKSYVVVASSAFEVTHPETPTVQYGFVYNETSAGRITGTSDTISLLMADKTLVDQASWTSTLSGGDVLQRSLVETMMTDTDQMSDFGKKSPYILPLGAVLYERTVVDLCASIDGIQETVPVGYGYDEAGNCELLSNDVCGNIELIQLEAPIGMLPDTNGTCVIDICSNIGGLQSSLPAGYSVLQNECQKLENRTLYITELFANMEGSDAGYEFIELFNPNSEPVPLTGYLLAVGKNFEKVYPLVESGSARVIGPGEYLTFYDSQLGFTLLNTSSGARLITPAGTTTSETSYTDPGEGQSWSSFEEGWSYTDIMTPGFANARPSSVVDEETGMVKSSFVSCASGKYRHPITNRCRSIESDATMLVACDSDEYRNPETNRCRKVASLASSLIPCSEGYDRNPETNRCRKLTSAANVLAACQVGYERNPTTNRCRKATAFGATNAAVSEPVTSNSSATTVLLAAAGVSAMTYGLYEWRSELGRTAKKLLHLIAGR